MATPEIQITQSEDASKTQEKGTSPTGNRDNTNAMNRTRGYSFGSSDGDDASFHTSPFTYDVIDDVPGMNILPKGDTRGPGLCCTPPRVTSPTDCLTAASSSNPATKPRRNSDSQAFMVDPEFRHAIIALGHTEDISVGYSPRRFDAVWKAKETPRETGVRRQSLPVSKVYSVQEETSDSTLSVKSAPISPLGRMATRNFFENKLGLAEDLKFISRMPELCDVTFLVGDRREPVCAVRAILAARSRVFHKLLYTGTVTPSSSPRRRANSMESRFARKTVSFLTRSKSNGDPDGVNSASKCPRTVIIEEFEPTVFYKLVEYCHTGCVVLNADTVLGLMNAADHYGLDELRRACIEYMHVCLNLSTVCLLLSSAEKYIQYKATKSLVQRALEFVDDNGEDVLRFPAFLKLPQHVVRLILSRDELQADELTKFHAALAWSTLHFRNTPGTTLKGAMAPFVDTIAFHLIPASTLMQEVKDSGVVPDQKIMTALAFQADPGSVDARALSATPNRLRLSMLSLSLEDRSVIENADTDRTDLSDDDEGSDDCINECGSRGSMGSPTRSPELRRLSTVDSDDGLGTNNRTDQTLFENEGHDDSGHYDNTSNTIFESIPDNHEYHSERPQSADEFSGCTATSLSNFDSMSMSTNSDVTDSSSAGGSFGRADQKNSSHSTGVKSPIPGTPL
ncbi:uncharacterized protein LOC117300075 [Asterias rubens]|uniref:uncharacterized protein LOC117300075 n=1 Tax=Asterias rubens TaxID=7604 RepID=UPI001455A963|nr:uncharacterized protein LOC117300075 [Asterias rubens]